MRRCADTRAQAAIKTVAARSPPQALASIVPEETAGQLGHGTPAQPHILDILQDAFNFQNSASMTNLLQPLLGLAARCCVPVFIVRLLMNTMWFQCRTRLDRSRAGAAHALPQSAMATIRCNRSFIHAGSIRPEPPFAAAGALPVPPVLYVFTYEDAYPSSGRGLKWSHFVYVQASSPGRAYYSPVVQRQCANFPSSFRSSSVECAPALGLKLHSQ